MHDSFKLLAGNDLEHTIFEDVLILEDPNLNHVVSQCKYHNLSSITHIHNTHLSIIHINARSVKNKFDDIQILLNTSGVDWSVICITESWLEDDLLKLFAIDRYNLFASCRSHGKGGGTMIYVNKQYEARERTDLNSDLIETTFVEMQISNTNKKSIIIGSIYRPPGFSHASFSDYMEKLLDLLESDKKLSVLGGDFNYNLFNRNVDKHVLHFSDLLASYGFSPTIFKPTRSQNQQHSLLDNFFTNDLSLLNSSGIIIDDISDHFPIFISLSLNQILPKTIDNKSSVLDKNKICDLRCFLQQKLQNFQSNTDANIACNELINVFQEGIAKYSKSVRKTSRNTSLKPWISPSLLSSINRKNKLYKKFLKRMSSENENKYKQYRNILSKILRDAKRLYYQNLLHENKNNSKKTWQILNEIVNRRKARCNELPSTFIGVEGKIFEGAEIADGFNHFFSSIGSQLEQKIPSSDSSPLMFLDEPLYENFNKELHTNSIDVVNIIKSLNLVGGGIDKISTNVLLLTYECIISHLTFFFNLCLRTAVFPTHLKVAIIKPIFKAGEKNSFNNYRPISLLPILSKILEKILFNYISSYLNEHNVLHPLQFGFRKAHSTYMPIAHLVDQITSSLQNKLTTCVLYLDLKKAFDTVSFNILLDKLYYIGIKGNLHKMIQSYLTNRTQKTQINLYTSGEEKVNMGVPQGSILGPLLFIIYINDLANVFKEVDFYFFADDTAISIKGSSENELQIILDKLLPLVTKWFQVNRLSLNVSKTNYQIYSRKVVSDLTIEINKAKILRKKTIKYLGIIVDENLKWTSHISNVSMIISRSLGIMGRAKYFLTAYELKLLYNTMILPHLNYCAAVWGSNYATNVFSLVKLQKRALRIIDKKPCYHPSRELFIKYKVLKFTDLVTEQLIIILLGYLNQSLPQPILSMFRYYTPVSTRAIQHFQIPYAATNYKAFSLSVVAPKAWNSIVCCLYGDVKNVPRTKNVLKKRVRQYILDKY